MLVMENLGNTAWAPSENAQKDAQIDKVDDRHAKVDCQGGSENCVDANTNDPAANVTQGKLIHFGRKDCNL